MERQIPAHVPWGRALPNFARGWTSELQQVKDALQVTSGGFTFLEANGKVAIRKELGKPDRRISTCIRREKIRTRAAEIAADRNCGSGRVSACHYGMGRSPDLARGRTLHPRSPAGKPVMSKEHTENGVSPEIPDTKTAKK